MKVETKSLYVIVSLYSHITNSYKVSTFINSNQLFITQTVRHLSRKDLKTSESEELLTNK